MKFAAIALLAIVFLASLAPVSYDTQSRESISSPPSKQFLLGTDDLGRDRFSRLLYGTRISLLLEPCAAALTLLIAVATVGGQAYAVARAEPAKALRHE